MPFSGDAAALRAMMFGGRSSGRLSTQGERMVVAFKYIVPPCATEDFIDAWKDLESRTVKDQGNIIFDLKKTEIDNFMFLEYAEWESGQDFYDHFESKHVEDFANFCAEHGITWLLRPLKPVIDDPDTPSRRVARKGDERLAHVLIRYFVPADKHETFMDAFEDTARKTWKEPGNRIFSLRKSATDNVQFWGYGTWESMEDFVDHFKSDHVRDLKQFARDNDIVWMLSPLYKIGEQPEIAF